MSRISELPARDWSEHAEPIADAMSAMLRTPNGQQDLRPVQGVALYELSYLKGAYLGLTVGAGKTHIAACAPTVLEAKRPLQVVPGKLLKKTKREFRELHEHWKLPAFYPTESYERLALEVRADYFWDYRPDLIVFDESQKLKNRKTAAVAKRLARYLEWCEQHGVKPPMLVFLSGSPTKDKLSDFAHLLLWALGDGTPLPRAPEVWEKWGSIVDARKDDKREADLRALKGDFGNVVSIAEARKRIRDRIRSTPGVILTHEPFDWPLEISARAYDLPDHIVQYYPDLRNDWIAPDGMPLVDAQTEVWAHAMRLSVGLKYWFDPWPPDDWRLARKLYGCAVRRYTESGRYDTEKQVRTAIEAGLLHCPEYWDWVEIEPTFQLHTVKEVIDPIASEVAAQWLSEVNPDRAIIWVHHATLGKSIEKNLGIPFHRNHGLDKNGKEIDKTRGPCVASIKACCEGFNLQHDRCDNLFLEFPRGQDFEQSLGRTHRPGQKHRPVTAQFAWACYEHRTAIDKSMAEARYAEHTLGIPQKLLQSKPKGCRVGQGPQWDPPDRRIEMNEAA